MTEVSATNVQAQAEAFANQWAKSDPYYSAIQIVTTKVDIPERNYKENEGVYAVSVTAEYR